MPEKTEDTNGTTADPDALLVERVRSGDRRAFETLVRRHERRVFRTALAVTGNEQDAEEALQDTFLKAYQHLDEFRGDARFFTWITRIAVNEGLQRTRRRKPVVSLDDPEVAPDSLLPQSTDEWHSSPERRYAAAETKRIVEEAIRSLPPAYRVALVLRDVEGLSTEEAAATLGLGVPALKSRLLRARLMLREALAPQFKRPPNVRTHLRRAGMVVRNLVDMGMEKVTGHSRGRA